ncbi:hypothetical protein ON010_g4712 [Phytophthora cinnamomi]|nr:hypothetical protein ON010_g4712 [Phytophthora cinnamomi]
MATGRTASSTVHNVHRGETLDRCDVQTAEVQRLHPRRARRDLHHAGLAGRRDCDLHAAAAGALGGVGGAGGDGDRGDVRARGGALLRFAHVHGPAHARPVATRQGQPQEQRQRPVTHRHLVT